MLNTIQSMLSPAGIQAERIEGLWWVMFWVTTVVTVLVWIALGIALTHRGRRTSHSATASSDRPLLTAIVLAAGASAVILFGLLIASVVTGRAVASQRDETALVVEVIAQQWWWNVEYQHPEPEQRVRTANELHLPIGRTVAIKLLATDVIHSFWVPALHGKLDAIPGHSTVLWLRPDRAGVYRGQCAEYCGLQHAHMAFTVVVEESDAFERWIQGQRTLAVPPVSAEAKEGLRLVESGPCALCHTIRGTSAGARTGPDLTHLATRSTLAAGSLPNTPEHLGSWIANPQAIKPGVRMPLMGLSADHTRAIVAYLQGLK